jgi:homoserine dehydrogenase
MGDVVTAARNRVRGTVGPGESTYSARAITPHGQVVSRYYVSLRVHDEPGVLAKVATAFATAGISLQAVRQDGVAVADQARLGVMTHQARADQLEATQAALAAMPDVEPGITVMRVEGA